MNWITGLVSVAAFLFSLTNYFLVRRAGQLAQFNHAVERLHDQRHAISSIFELESTPYHRWDKAQRERAHQVCGLFHLLGILAMKKHLSKQLLCQAWYYSIPKLRTILHPFILEMRETRDYRYWKAFDYLANAARDESLRFTGFSGEFHPESIRGAYKQRASTTTTHNTGEHEAVLTLRSRN